MIIQGQKIKSWGKNVYVKVPIVNSKGKFMGSVIKELNQQKVKLNITAVYTAKQTKKILERVDKKTRVKVIKMINNISRDKTILVVTHDPEILSHLDHVYKLDQIHTPSK